MYNGLLCATLFLLVCYAGYVISGTKRARVKCVVVGKELVIEYKRRTIYVTLDKGTRIPTYRRKGSFEYITVPNGTGKEVVEQMEHWADRSRPSLLVKALFKFSQLSHPVDLLRFDPAYGRELSKVQQELYNFIRL